MDNTTDQANIFAAQNALEYLAEVNTYDLRELGEERFKTLIEVITKNYHEKYLEITEIDVDTPPW